MAEGEGASSGTIHRTARLLAALADADGEVRVSDLSEQLGLPVSTVHRLLQLLRQEGLVDHHPATRGYSPGAALHRIAARVVRQAQAPDLARRHAQALAERFGETCLFGLYLPSPPAVSFAARAEGRHALQYRLAMDTPLSLVQGASGKSILAYLPEESVDRALALEPERSDTGRPRPSREALEEELRAVRRDGFAQSVGEKLAGARGMAAPVFSPRGVCGSLCITAPADRVSVEGALEIMPALKAEAAALSWSLGATGVSAGVES